MPVGSPALDLHVDLGSDSLDKVLGIIRGVTGAPGGMMDTIHGAAMSLLQSPQSHLGWLTEKAKSELLSEVLDEKREQNLRDLAYVNAEIQTLKQQYTGGCPRDYSGCPMNFFDDGATCSGDKDSFCGSFAKDLPIDKKEEIAWKCRAQWPCVDPQFVPGCPPGWENLGNDVCRAPQNYQGICSPITDFSQMDSDARRNWMAMCL